MDKINETVGQADAVVSAPVELPDSATLYGIKVRKVFEIDSEERVFAGMVPLLVCETMTGAEDVCERFAAMDLWNGCEFEAVPIKCAL